MHTPSPTQSTPTRSQQPAQTSGLTVKTHVKAGGTLNHSQTLVQAPRPAPGLTVKTHIKAGYPPGPSRS